MTAPQTVQVLLVEDNEVDVIAVQRAFRKQKMINPITVAQDGIEALNFLRGTDGKKKLSEPFIVLLDLNLPRMNGFEFLKALREDPVLKSSVVFVLTTSSDNQDRHRANEFNIAGYMVKSDGFLKAVEMVDTYLKSVGLS